IVPDSTAIALVSIKYPATDIRLGQSAAEFIALCARAQGKADGAGFREVARQWLRKKRGLQEEARALGHLSAVDGCVVVDRGLNLFGFGGHIEVGEAQAREAGRVLADYRTRKARPESDLNCFGTRHLSAFRLCQAAQDCIVFVVSQDGHLRI